MKDKRILRGFFILLTAVTLIAGWAGFWILYKTGNIFAGYLYIPLFFFLYGTGYILFLKKVISYNPHKQITFFVGARMLKLFLSVLLVLVCGLFLESYLVKFTITFLVFYLLYMVLELFFFFGVKNNDKGPIKQK